MDKPKPRLTLLKDGDAPKAKAKQAEKPKEAPDKKADK